MLKLGKWTIGKCLCLNCAQCLFFWDFFRPIQKCHNARIYTSTYFPLGHIFKLHDKLESILNKICFSKVTKNHCDVFQEKLTPNLFVPLQKDTKMRSWDEFIVYIITPYLFHGVADLWCQNDWPLKCWHNAKSSIKGSAKCVQLFQLCGMFINAEISHTGSISEWI